MRWNWQHPHWPIFTFDPKELLRFEILFAEGAGLVVGTSQHLENSDLENLHIDMMSRDALNTSAIEGELLDLQSVQSSIQHHFGLRTERRRSEPSEAGIAEMMVDLYRNLVAPLTHETLFTWHRMLTNGRRDLKDIGRYRTHSEPMQIVSGADYAARVHFEAPPSRSVVTEIDRFFFWFHDTSPLGNNPLPTVTRAGISHLWFESIHPFEDGNGRIGRAIAEKALAQGLLIPSLTCIAGMLLKRRKDYYHALAKASQTLEITSWLMWFAETCIEAQQRSLEQVTFVLQKTKILTRIHGQLNTRQEKAILRLFAAGPEGFVGGLSASNYMKITGATPATTTRDLAELVELCVLTKTGERKSTRYHLILSSLPKLWF